MTILYFVHPNAHRLEMTVDAVNSGKRLLPGKGYKVADELVESLLATGDWAKEKAAAVGSGQWAVEKAEPDVSPAGSE